MKRCLAGLLLAAMSLGAQTSQIYYLVLLRRAPDRKTLPKAEADSLQAAHMANIRSMADRGVLVAAGPFEDTPPEISGLFVMRAASLDEARRIASADPTVVEHRNTVEALVWRGPRGIGEEYVRLHRADPKTPEDMAVHALFVLRRGKGGDGDAWRSHEGYLAELRRQGKIGAAGAVEGDAEVAGVVIFRRMAESEARALMDADPAVQSGALRVEFHKWWCSAHVLPE